MGLSVSLATNQWGGGNLYVPGGYCLAFDAVTVR